MSKIIIEDNCINCKKCIQICMFGALVAAEKKVMVTDDCTLCLRCVDICPTGSISILKEKTIKKEVIEKKGILIVAQIENKKISPIVFELIGEGVRLKKEEEKLSVLLIGYDLSSPLDELKKYPIDEIYLYDNKKLEKFSAFHYKDSVVDCIEKLDPNIVIFPATLEGRSLAPAVAIVLGTGLTADCTSLTMEGRNLIQTRPAYGGNIMADIKTQNHRPQMATVRKGVMKKAELDFSSTPKIVYRETRIKFPNKLTVVKENLIKNTEFGIDTAKIILAVGNGVEENDIKKLLALEKEGLAVGCTRIVVEKGWLDSSRQIGLSGKSVSPELLIAIGVSGSVQFLAGIGGAKNIVAINIDKNAPIFRVSDQGIISEASEVIENIT